MKRIVIDMLGGDKGLAMSIPAVRRFHKEHPSIPLALAGPKEELAEFSDCEIIPSSEAVPMECGALEVLRHKESSLMKAISFMKEGKASGIVSAGSTGGFLSAATIVLKKLEGISRPALVTAFPKLSKEGGFVTLLDVGASNENTAEEINQFALMGSLYSEIVFGKKEPSVYLLSNGTEKGKGSPVGKESYSLLEANKSVNFKGNVEGNGILLGDADVVVSDGYSGNILLKSTEGTAKGVGVLLKKAFKRNIFTKIGYLFAKKGIVEMKDTMDPKKVGGALLLGINGLAVKAHGNSDEEAFYHALELMERLLEGDILSKIQKGLADANNG